jgi:hypothetical protein
MRRDTDTSWGYGDVRTVDMRGDDRWTPGEQAPQRRTSAHSSGRQARGPSMFARRGALIGLGAIVALAAIALLTACLYTAAVPLLARVLAAPPTVPLSPTSVPSPPASATALATATPKNGDWDPFTLYDGGFRVDVPGVLGSSHGYFINDFSGQGVDLSYTGATLSTPLQRLEAQVKVSVLYSTKITDHNICPQGGAPIQIGPGNARIPAWQRDAGDTVRANLVLNGEAIEISMTSRVSGQSALPYYADIWQHMLASLAPLPSQPAGTTHPCG